jgi:hypothetical protein
MTFPFSEEPFDRLNALSKAEGRPANGKLSSMPNHALLAAHSYENQFLIYPRRGRIYDPVVVSRSDRKKTSSASFASAVNLNERGSNELLVSDFRGIYIG